MPDEHTHSRRHRRGPAPGRLWSGVALEDGPRPEAPTQPLPEGAFEPPQPPEPPAPADADPAARPPRRGGLRASILAGALSGLAVAAAALAIGGGFDDDDANPESGALPPAVASAAGAKASNSAVGRVYAAASPAIVSVQTSGGSGTGFLVDTDGTIVSNAHVVGTSTRVAVRFGDKGNPVNGRVVGRDEGSDLAVIKVDASAAQGVRPLAFADSDDVKVGDLTVAIGNPLGLPSTATAGIVSGLKREIRSPDGFQIDEVIQTDAPINPGNSGGPLLNERGQVIGVNSQIATAGGGGGNIGIGFAVPANTAKEIVPQLRAGQKIERPYIGVSTAPSTSGGATVAEVTPGSPADRAGIGQGDVITKINGEEIQTPDDVAGAITDKKPGDSIDIEVRRGPAAESVQVELGQRPDNLPGG
jgi:putative serine protease PepD